MVIAFQRCSKDETLSPSTEVDLITNGSFESHGVPSLDGWRASTTDTAFINLVADTPPGGGSFSVRLKNDWGTPGNLRQTIVPSNGTHRYRLSSHGKTIRYGQYAGGTFWIHIKRGNSWTTSNKILHFSDTTWTSTWIVDTLTTTPSDTLEVSISGDGGQWPFGYVLVDMVKFERLD
jgi:hypothetical protein